MQKQLFTTSIASLLCLSLVLPGCGGGGGSTAPASTALTGDFGSARVGNAEVFVYPVEPGKSMSDELELPSSVRSVTLTVEDQVQGLARSSMKAPTGSAALTVNGTRSSTVGRDLSQGSDALVSIETTNLALPDQPEEADPNCCQVESGISSVLNPETGRWKVTAKNDEPRTVFMMVTAIHGDAQPEQLESATTLAMQQAGYYGRSITVSKATRQRILKMCHLFKWFIKNGYLDRVASIFSYVDKALNLLGIKLSDKLPSIKQALEDFSNDVRNGGCAGARDRLVEKIEGREPGSTGGGGGTTGGTTSGGSTNGGSTTGNSGNGGSTDNGGNSGNGGNTDNSGNSGNGGNAENGGGSGNGSGSDNGGNSSNTGGGSGSNGDSGQTDVQASGLALRFSPDRAFARGEKFNAIARVTSGGNPIANVNVKFSLRYNGNSVKNLGEFATDGQGRVTKQITVPTSPHHDNVYVVIQYGGKKSEKRIRIGG